jgi:hypothetical protein
MQIPADENAKPVYVEFEGDLFWVNINRRGEMWINTREKPQPVFRVVAGKRLSDEETAAAMPQQPQHSGQPSESGASQRERDRERDRESQNQRAEQQRAARDDSARDQQASREGEPDGAAEGSQQEQSPRSFLSRVRGLMRRNRRGHGWSGSFPFLTKALKTDEAGLLEQLAQHGVVLPPEGSGQPVFHEDADFVYWMNKNQRGEIWINARKGRKPENGRAHDDDSAGGDESAAPETASPEPGAMSETQPAENAPPVSTESEMISPGAAATAVTPAQFREPSVPLTATAPGGSADGTLAAVRLLMQPKKRGEGVAALVGTLSQQLGQTEDVLLGALTAAGLNVPEDARAKPKFAEHAGEIFWLNRSSKGELWLNAKAAKSRRSRKSTDDGEDEDSEES